MLSSKAKVNSNQVEEWHVTENLKLIFSIFMLIRFDIFVEIF